MSLEALVPRRRAESDLRAFSLLVMLPLLLYGLKELSAWRQSGDWRSLAFGLALLAQFSNHAACLLLLGRGRFEGAMRLSCWGILVLYGFGSLRAQGDPVAGVIPLMGVALALPQLRGAEFKAYLTAAWLGLLLNLGGMLFFPVQPEGSALQVALARLLSCSAGLGATLLLLWQIKRSLAEGESVAQQAESEAGREAGRYRLIVENAHEGIGVFGMDGSVAASNALMGELLATEGGARVKEMLFGRCIAGESVSHELQIEGPAGRRWIMLNARPLRGPGGRIQGALALATEISALKELQRELDLALGSEAEGRLAGGIAHDMNNVLAVINGACDLMSRQLDPAPPAVRQALEEMRRPAAEATAAVRQLLAFRSEPEAAPGAQASGGKERILLVDDEPEVRSVTARMLRLHGYEVLEAGSAAEATAMHGLTGADLLLTDIIMPGTSGTVLAGRLRAVDPKLAVLFSSGYAGDELPESEARLEHSAFIAKPFSASELNQKLREALMLARQGRP